MKGKANEELISFLAEALGIKRGQIALEKGATGRRKVVAIEGLSAEEVQRRLKAFAAADSSKR